MEYLFYLFVFSIPLQARLILFQSPPAFNEWTSGFLWGTDILLMFLLVGWLVRSIQAKTKPRPDRIDWLLIVFLSIAGISMLFAKNTPVAWYRFFKLVEYGELFWYIKYYARPFISFQKLAIIVGLSGVFQALLGIVQYALQSSVGLNILGESVLSVEAQGVAVLIANSQKYLRAYGTTPHPNVLAAWLMLALWGLAYWYVHSKHRYRLAMLGGFTITLFGFYLTYSRIAIAVWIVASLIMAFRCGKKSRSLLIAASSVSIIFVFAFWPHVQSRLQISASDEAIEQRIFYANVATQTSREHPLLGIGIGQFVPMLMKKLPHYPAYIYQPAHVLYLLILDELGFAGLVVFAGFIFLLTRRIFFKNKTLFIIVVAMLILGLFDHFYWTLQQGGLMFWLFWGILSYI